MLSVAAQYAKNPNTQNFAYWAGKPGPICKILHIGQAHRPNIQKIFFRFKPLPCPICKKNILYIGQANRPNMQNFAYRADTPAQYAKK